MKTRSGAVMHRITDMKHHDGRTKLVRLTRSKAIKALCVECMGGSVHDVRKCTSYYCPLYPFRTGTIDRSLEKKYIKEAESESHKSKDTSSTSTKRKNKRSNVFEP